MRQNIVDKNPDRDADIIGPSVNTTYNNTTNKVNTRFPLVWYQKINKKEKQLALRTILYNRHEQFLVFNEFKFDEAKTADFLEKVGNNGNGKKTLVISSKPNKNLQLSLRNLKNFNYILANQLNVSEIVKANQIIIDELSFQVIKETYCDKN